MVMGTRVNVRSSRQMDKPSRPGSIRSTSTIRGGSERTAATTSRPCAIHAARNRQAGGSRPAPARASARPRRPARCPWWKASPGITLAPTEGRSRSTGRPAERAAISPPWAATVHLHSASPSPAPPRARSRNPSTRYSLNSRVRRSASVSYSVASASDCGVRFATGCIDESLRGVGIGRLLESTLAKPPGARIMLWQRV